MSITRSIAAMAALGIAAFVVGGSAVGPVAAQGTMNSGAIKKAGLARHEAAVDKEEAYRQRMAQVKKAGLARHEAAVDKEEAYRQRMVEVKKAGLARHEAAVDKEEAYRQRVAAEKAAKLKKH